MTMIDNVLGLGMSLG